MSNSWFLKSISAKRILILVQISPFVETPFWTIFCYSDVTVRSDFNCNMFSSKHLPYFLMCVFVRNSSHCAIACNIHCDVVHVSSSLFDFMLVSNVFYYDQLVVLSVSDHFLILFDSVDIWINRINFSLTCFFFGFFW